MQDNYTKNIFRYLIDNFQISIENKNNNTITQRIAIFICFNVVLFCVFFIIWIPLISKLQKDVKSFYMKSILKQNNI